jgi:CheY-like chemotaxis protein
MSRPYSVLLVEDDDPLRAILVELLQARGWRIYSTDEGHEAVELAKHHHVDFSILDMHLPGITGLEVFTHISREVRPLPSIMISGGATRQETQAALQSGVFRFLMKPLAFDHLQHCLDQLIQHHFPPLGPR